MNLLLDTHTVLWLLSDPGRLSSKALDAIVADENVCYVSIASLWEMTIKASKGSLELPGRSIGFVVQALHDYSYEILLVEPDDIEVLEQLPKIERKTHKDPFDRMIVSQALRHQMTLVTMDSILREYGASLLWD